MPHPPIPISRVTGIILAGGKSSRFGSNKALFEYQGKKLVEYSIEILHPLCGQLLLSTNQPEIFAFTGLQTVSDVYPDCGPVGGIHACLQQSTTEHNLVTGCDLPWLDTRLFEYILGCSPSYQVVMPMHKGFKETMASYYHQSCAETLEKALQEKHYKIFDAIAPLKTFYPEIDEQDFYSEKLFANVNYREDIG
ncbi:MAG: molybdenum cofactor guanylyltransferase [Bacteroidetes bacterium]|nr:MAG: molybdenum cofactor guanylyltransferase [Bacteroidota bacterium]